jgi:holo-[acyl-carrier protein] synthase
MIVGTGIDIAEVPRIRQSIERFGDRFLRAFSREGEIRIATRRQIVSSVTPRASPPRKRR